MEYKRIVITGFMGTGKTVAGNLVAARLQWLFFDTDLLVEASESMTISQIFEQKGEDYFRKLESRCLENLLTMSEIVIATGGGTLLNPENLSLAQQDALLVRLQASEEEIRKRIGEDQTRPLLQGGDFALARLLQEREAAYQEMGRTIDTTGKTPETVAGEILELFGVKPTSQL